MQAQSDVPGVVSGNHDDVEYDAFLQRVQARFVANISNGSKPLFTTDAEDLNQDLGKVETAVSNSELIRRYAPTHEEVDNVITLLAGMNASNWVRKRNEALDILLGH